MIGLDSDAVSAQTDVGDTCNALFGQAGWAPDKLPIALFSDYFCAICGEFEPRLHRLAHERAELRIIRHELPLLGARSVAAAKLAIAARAQGAYEPVSRELMQRNLRPGDSALRQLADRHGLDATQLKADRDSAEVAAELDRELALGRRLGIPGTPALIVGRTLVIGSMADRDLVRLIDLEISDSDPPCR
ncbi:DsbA family protein [Sulfitobacter sp. LCG007]